MALFKQLSQKLLNNVSAQVLEDVVSVIENTAKLISDVHWVLHLHIIYIRFSGVVAEDVPPNGGAFKETRNKISLLYQ